MLAAIGRSRTVRLAADRLRPFYRRVQPWTGLNGLDRKVLPYLPERGGYFVEAGANDGLKQSNTFYLESRRGWRGLLVEPIPELADRCRQNRPGSTVLSAALVSPDMEGKPVELVDVDLMSLVTGARGSTDADDAHVRAAEQVQGLTRRTRTVIGRTLSSLLDEAAAPQIDFLSLDVEGFEEQALLGLDGSRHAPLWILVEVKDIDAIKNALGGRYQVVDQLSLHDWLFRRVDIAS